ncbi:Cell division protein FtsI/penicillin-binding protein 2 [Flavimobilis marinus]|uniref:Cell division protein FtsI/penicillin-binding protein 2 n=1 Tax=Flavimobilis marinus TaxID=285351 RepID=A0A1I2FU01_9MICO|nr:penicillin-binding transpeptidase domain-containing protein [Flavimobilis marinus]SFF08904.1 Cell division protein FtsI/penicillin-binding protein 2 [Flavimobilis marinus]
MSTARTRTAQRGAVALVVTALLGLTACTPERPGPAGEAQDLAAALSSGSFADVALADGVTAQGAADQRAAAFAGLEPATPQVSVASVTVATEDENRAVATLDLAWDLGAAEPWTYATEAYLTWDEDAEAWLASWSPTLLAPGLAPGETLVRERVRAERGRVLGAGDTPIVEDRAVQRIGIDKTRGEADQQEADARELAEALEMDGEAFAAQVAAAGPKAFVQAIVVREEDDAYDIAELTSAPTAVAVPDTLPLAPTRTFARPLLGTAGEATAEIIEASQGSVVAGDTAGLSGLQLQHDALLRGSPGLTVLARSADGETRDLFSVEPVAGADLRTTLDLDVQQEAEAVLDDVEPASAIVALRPSTGEVLAAASGPGGGGLSTATLGQYPPGSVFKVVTGLAWLRSGATPESTVACPATITVDGREFENFPGYPQDALGDVPLRTAFANSCNTAFIGARDDVTPAAVADAATALGLTGQTELGYSAFLGEVPADSTGTDHAASMIGQGRVLASPLGMATVAASVAEGTLVTPRLVVADDAPAASEPAAPLSQEEAASLRALMRAVVTDGGATFLADVPGEEIGAKTGTAQFGPSGDTQNHVWMIATQGDLAVAVFVEVGEYGSTTAGPLLEDFLARLQ